MSDEPRSATAVVHAPAVGGDPSTVQHVDDHPFEPRGAWFTTCRHCRLAEAAHRETTVAARDRR